MYSAQTHLSSPHVTREHPALQLLSITWKLHDTGACTLANELNLELL